MNKALCAISNQSRKYKTRIKQYNKSLHLGLPRGYRNVCLLKLSSKEGRDARKNFGIKVTGVKIFKTRQWRSCNNLTINLLTHFSNFSRQISYSNPLKMIPVITAELVKDISLTLFINMFTVHSGFVLKTQKLLIPSVK